MNSCISNNDSNNKKEKYPVDGDLNLKISMNKYNFAVNESSFWVNLTLKNISNKTLIIEYSFSLDTFIKVWVTTEMNIKLYPLIYPVDPSRVKIILKPNEILEENFLFFNVIWYNSTYYPDNYYWNYGNYTIYSSYFCSFLIESNSINFKIIK